MEHGLRFKSLYIDNVLTCASTFFKKKFVHIYTKLVNHDFVQLLHKLRD